MILYFNSISSFILSLNMKTFTIVVLGIGTAHARSRPTSLRFFSNSDEELPNWPQRREKFPPDRGLN